MNVEKASALTTSDNELCQGLTDETRREIRNCQRSLREEIPSLEISDALQKNNEIFENVRYVRESILDADNLKEIVKQAHGKIKTIQAPRYDTDRMIRKLVAQARVTKKRKSYFDWAAFGNEASKCFNTVPSNVTFWNGIMHDDKAVHNKRMKKAIRKVEDMAKVEEERPLEIQGEIERNANRLSAVEENVQAVQKALVQKVKQTYKSQKRNIADVYGGVECIPQQIQKRLRNNKDVCAVELLFDPKSFTQTVENLYSYSFLVKDGTASLRVRDDTFLDEKNKLHCLRGGPVANVTSGNSKAESTPKPKPRQAIVSLTMDDWKNMVNAYNVKESDVKHR